MNKLSILLAAIIWAILSGHAYASVSGPDHQGQSLNTFIASQIQYMHDQEKLALDLNWEFQERWDEPIFQSLGAMERRHMDELLVLLDAHGLEPLVHTGTEGVYGNNDHTIAYNRLHSQGWESLLGAYEANAYVEEWDISELRSLINGTSEQSVIDTLTRLQTGAEKHLRMLVGNIKGLGYDYQAQILSQSDVDEICRGVEPHTGTDFTMNSGLTDTWYYPLTSGQGFFISIYPESQTVFVSWMIYDTDLPGEGSVSYLGNAGQRWLIAQGNYVGNRAELTVYSASGGLFDEVLSKVELEDIGGLTLQFDDCANGSIRYVLWPLWGGNMIPIERIAADNISRCELDAQP